MEIWEVVLIAVSLAMDALAVSVCKGLAEGKLNFKGIALCGLWFGAFQAIMPLIGFAFASIFSTYIKFITPWISFALLALLGVKTIIEAIKERNSCACKNIPTKDSSCGCKKSTEDVSCGCNKSAEDVSCAKQGSAYSISKMFVLAVATSIDALAIGVTFAFNGVTFGVDTLSNVWLFIAIIGGITLIITSLGNAVGSLVGSAFGKKFNFISELLGGIILCALAVKFLVEGIIDVSSIVI